MSTLALAALGSVLHHAGEQATPPAGPAADRTCADDPGSEVWIPGGTFRFGSDEGYPEEAPAHETRVAGFWMDRHEVTNAQFARFVAETGHVTVAERDPDRAEYPDIDPDMLVPGSAVFHLPGGAVLGPGRSASGTGAWAFMPGANWAEPHGPGSSIEGRARFPVVHIAYEDAIAYARWAGRDLPTEAEWELAARGGQPAWPGDDRPNADVGPDGRYRGNTWQGRFPHENAVRDGYAGAAPVGCFPPNGYGLYDMTGNVWEWTSSWYRPGHDETAPPGRGAPHDAGRPVRVIKGGSFLCAPNHCWRYRPAARQPQDVGFSTAHLGFRTVRRPERPPPGP